MPLVTIIFFFIFLGLLFTLNNVLRNRKKLRRAEIYGQKHFEIDLPDGAKIDNAAQSGIPPFSTLSDAEGFYVLVTPYCGSLNKHKRDFLFQHLNDLKNDLKIHKSIYQNFVTEHDIYKDLNDEQAAEKWSGK